MQINDLCGPMMVNWPRNFIHSASIISHSHVGLSPRNVSLVNLNKGQDNIETSVCLSTMFGDLNVKNSG